MKQKREWKKDHFRLLTIHAMGEEKSWKPLTSCHHSMSQLVIMNDFCEMSINLMGSNISRKPLRVEKMIWVIIEVNIIIIKLRATQSMVARFVIVNLGKHFLKFNSKRVNHCIWWCFFCSPKIIGKKCTRKRKQSDFLPFFFIFSLFQFACRQNISSAAWLRLNHDKI